MPKRATEQPEASRNAEMKHGLYFRPSSRFSKTFQICQIPPLLFIYSPKDLCGIPMSQSTKGQFDEIHGIHGIHRARRARLARAALADSKLFRCRRSWSIASTPVWGYPFMARWFMLISWKILENQKKMITGGTPMTKRKPPNGSKLKIMENSALKNEFNNAAVKLTDSDTVTFGLPT